MTLAIPYRQAPSTTTPRTMYVHPRWFCAATTASNMLDPAPLLERRLRRYGARIDAIEAGGALALLDEVPLSISLIAWRNGERGTYLEGIVRVPVNAAGRLAAAPRALDLRTIGAAVHLVKECILGDGPLRRAYLVTGDDLLASQALGEEARRALCAMQALLVSLTIEGGVLQIVWRANAFDETAVLPSAVVVTALEIAHRLVTRP